MSYIVIMLLYDWILLVLGLVIHVAIYYAIYFWISKTECDCMQTFHAKFLQFYLLFYFIYYTVAVFHLLIFRRTINTYDIGLIMINTAMIGIGIDYILRLENCYCSDSIEKQLLLLLIILYCLWYVSLILSFSFQYMK